MNPKTIDFVKSLSNDDIITMMDELYHRRLGDGNLKPNWLIKSKFEEGGEYNFLYFEEILKLEASKRFDSLVKVLMVEYPANYIK